MCAASRPRSGPGSAAGVQRLAKIVEGRLGAFTKQVALTEQEYARDNSKSVGQVLKDAGLAITGFARFKVGA